MLKILTQGQMMTAPGMQGMVRPGQFELLASFSFLQTTNLCVQNQHPIS